MDNIIAKRELVSLAPDGQRSTITIKIDEPKQLADSKWLSQVAVEGLYEDSPAIEGIDSFQALNLAFAVVREGLDQFIKNGGKLFWKDGSGELSVLDVFS